KRCRLCHRVIWSRRGGLRRRHLDRLAENARSSNIVEQQQQQRLRQQQLRRRRLWGRRWLRRLRRRVRKAVTPTTRKSGSPTVREGYRLAHRRPMRESPLTNPTTRLGIGWRPELAHMIDRRPDLDFIEVVAENITANCIPRPLAQLKARGATIVPH